MSRSTATPVTVLLAALMMPADAAHGAVVQLRATGDASVVTLQLTGLPGEANHVSIGRAADGTLTVRDDATRLIAGENCMGGGVEVSCPAGGPQAGLQLEIATSDGDDRISIDGALSYRSSYLSGGSGADAIVGGSHADSIYGNAGDDQLDGAGGDDEFFGFTGADELHGGPGVDTARYSTRGPLNVTLDDLPDDGTPGEGDNARQDVENVHAGGGRPIRIVGSDAANRLESDEGVAELVGGAGDDRLIARFGRAGSLIGGPGRDVLQPATDSSIDVRDGEVDRVRCHSGLARRPIADAEDRLIGCVPPVVLRGSTAAVTGGGGVVLRVRCHAIAQACQMRVELRWERQRIARARLRVGLRQRRVVVRLNRLGRMLTTERGVLPVTLRLQVVRTTPPRSSGFPSEVPITLERP